METQPETGMMSIAQTSVPLFGQKIAIQKIDKAIKRARSGLLGKRNKPFASMLLLGPSGVGKTESAKAIAEMVFGDRSRIARFNANECAGEGGQFKAFGPPRGYLGSDKGGLLTQQVKALEGQCVILVDEIEKGTQELFDGLMTALDEGYMEDASFGERIDVSESIIVMTSNILAGEDLSDLEDEDLRERIALSRVPNHKTGGEASPFRMEFVGRIQEVIHFDALDDVDIAGIIAHKYRNDTAVKIAVQYNLLIVDLSPIALGFLTNKVGQTKFGVRYVDTIINKYIVDGVIDYEDLPTEKSHTYIWDLSEDQKLILLDLNTDGYDKLAKLRDEPESETIRKMKELHISLAKKAIKELRKEYGIEQKNTDQKVLNHKMIVN
ncbi:MULTISPECIES: AAA family ATPase [Acidithiobacillus]|uniref:AAA family ATPase n=1 Tax=Acidithiobacillus TaxID=119977 RepID=UPI0004E16381|nr:MULTISPECIES: AAA family ATPase [Acidithiobacillus]